MGRWRSAEDDDLAYVQFLETKGDEEIVFLSLIRGKGTSFAKIVVHRLPDDFPHLDEVPCRAHYELEAGEGDRSLALTSTGFIVYDSAGRHVFTSGDGQYDDNLTPMQTILQRLTYELELRIGGHQLLFPVSETDRKLIRDCFSIS